MKAPPPNFSCSKELIYVEMRKEIMQHKWVESQKAGIDVGFESAAKDWEIKHSEKWLKSNKHKFNNNI